MTDWKISIDHDHSICDRPACSHNRWHPAIPPALSIGDGDRVTIETRDSLDGQIQPGWAAADLAKASLDNCHPLTGPILVEGAEPGDLLAVDIEEVITAPRGFTAIFPGFGLLRDDFPNPELLHWTLGDRYGTSEQLPGVYIPSAPFMGVMGLAPSQALLQRITAREAELAGRGAAVFGPVAAGAVPASGAAATHGLRTISPQEFGGNIDIRHLVRGAVLYLPVSEKGALFSAGDAHFAQGDGESCGTAVETSATLVARFRVLKGEAERRRQRFPTYEAPGDQPRGRVFATAGMAVRRDGRAEFEDLTLAARNAVRAMVDHIMVEYGFTAEQAYCLVSIGVDLRISQVVDIPNVLVSAFLPLDLFRKPG